MPEPGIFAKTRSAAEWSGARRKIAGGAGIPERDISRRETGKMGSVCFVILNYRTFQEAAACAKSVLNTQTYPDIRIVIVDNGSANGSAEELREQFAEEERVHVIAAERNLGFAQGNNLGIRYVREHFAPDFIVVANSDILFSQRDYCGQLFRIYRDRPFAILGGDIVDATGTQHFNPVARERRYTLKYMRRQVLVSRAKAAAFSMIKCFHLSGLFFGRRGKRTAGNQATREVDGKSVAADSRIEEELTGVLLHGCCLVFSQDFFREMDGFYEKTFLYAEEEILYYLALKKGLVTLYSPRVGCMHKEAVTTNTIRKDLCDAKIFYFSHITKSYRIFLKLMKEYER